jgi:hypothetical protein
MTEFWDRAEEHYEFADGMFRVLNEMDGRFPPRKRTWFVRVLRFLFGWVRRLIFKRPRLPPGGPADKGKR